jgi:hypothetical protein
VHLVRDPARAPAVARHATLAIVASILAAGIAACGESAPAGDADSAPTGGRDSLGRIDLASCEDWARASVEARERSIGRIRRFAGGPVAATDGGTGTVIPEADAYRLFETTCANEYARGFKLYKLYTRAAALGGG